MIGYKNWFLATLLFTLPGAALAGSSFEDAFKKYLEVRSLEHELKGIEFRETDELTRAEKRRELAAAVTEKRIEFQAILRADMHEFTPWQLKVLARLNTKNTRRLASLDAPSDLDKNAVDYLSAAYPDAKKLSVIEWQAIGEWFGPRTQEAFLRIGFAMEKAPRGTGKQETPPVVLVQSPFQRITTAAGTAKYRANERWLKSTEASLAQLKQAGIKPVVLEVSAFNKIEEQAGELARNLKEKFPDGFVLVSAGDASAIVNKALDLHPELRQSERVLGWLNLNGRLYGLPAMPVDEKKKNPLNSMERAAAAEMYRLNQEILAPTTPLGDGFPIVNLVATEGESRPAANLRESLVPDGRTFFTEKNDPSATRELIRSFGRTPASNASWKEAPAVSGPSL